jgi:hypothetical protein
MSLLKTIRQSAKAWVIGLVTPLVIGLLLGKADVVKVPYTWVYPDRDWIGCVAFPMSSVPSGQQDRVDLVLVRHSMSPSLLKVDFIRRGTPTAAIGRVMAGFAAHAAGNATTLSGGVNGTRIVELEFPPAVLAGAGIELRNLPVKDDASYVAVAGDIVKEVNASDLVVLTKNEERRTLILFCFVTAAISIAALFVLQFKVKHPADQDLEDQQWV